MHFCSLVAGDTIHIIFRGMHITLAEQLSTDRPPGIRDLYQRMAHAAGDAHEAEHQMMECLGQVLWEAQRAGRQPDEHAYIGCLQGLLRSPSR